MTIDERLRINIHTKLTELLGSEEADALIAHIMPVPWHDVATKDDIQLVRNEMTIMNAELRTEMTVMRAELRTEMADFRTELHQAIISQTRWLLGYVTALSVVMLGVARLLF